MAKHCKLSASASSRWMNCPGSVEAEKDLTSVKHDSAIEGTFAHMLAELCLNNDKDSKNYFNLELTLEGDGEITTYQVDLDMCKYVQEYLDYVRSYETKSSKLYIEHEVKYSFLDKSEQNRLWGTSDCILINEDNNAMHVFDLKYGLRDETTAYNNSQLLIYALAAYKDLEAVNKIKRIEIHIVKPRQYHISSDVKTVEELLKFEELLKDKVTQALNPKSKRIAGAKQCKWCKARYTCSTLDDYNFNIVGDEFDDLSKISDERYKQILDNKQLIERFLKDVKSHIEMRLMGGGKLGGYKLVQSRSKRKWKDGVDLESLIGEKAYNKKLIGITEASKILDVQTIDKLTTKSNDKLQLVSDEDSRESVDITNMFEKLKK